MAGLSTSEALILADEFVWKFDAKQFDALVRMSSPKIDRQRAIDIVQKLMVDGNLTVDSIYHNLKSDQSHAVTTRARQLVDKYEQALGRTP